MNEMKEFPLPRARDEQNFSVCIGAHDQKSFTSCTSFTEGDEAASVRPRPPGSGNRAGLRLFGSITYSWHGETRSATALPPDARPPAVIIALHDEWVTVSTIGHGTEIVAWEWVHAHALTGWSPVLEQRLSEPTHETTKCPDSSRFVDVASANSHRLNSHQPDSAHLDVRGERDADAAALEEDPS